MSVRVGDRDEGKLRVIEAMRKLILYTHEKIKSDTFPKSERWIIAKTKLYPLRQGVKFLQWRFILTDSGKIVMKMNAAKVGKERQRTRKLAAKEAAGEIPAGTTWNSVQSWMGNAMRGDSYFSVKRMEKYYKETMGRYQDGNGTGKTIESGT